jgi:hypothetical protein
MQLLAFLQVLEIFPPSLYPASFMTNATAQASMTFSSSLGKQISSSF